MGRPVGGPQNPPRNHNDPNVAKRAMIVFDAVLSGHTYAEAAEIAGMSKGGAHKAVQRVIRQTLSLKADEYRTLNTMRLEKLLKAVWPLATDTREPNLWAVDRSLVIIGALNKLHGLEIPTARDPFVGNIPTIREYVVPEGTLEAV